MADKHQKDLDSVAEKSGMYISFGLHLRIQLTLTIPSGLPDGSSKQGKVFDRYRRLYLITYPRSASNLLVRILALDQQSNVMSRKSGGYFFLNAFRKNSELGNKGKHINDWTEDERKGMMESFQKCFDELEEHAEAAEADGKVVFVKEHVGFIIEPTAKTRFLFGEDSVTESPWTVKVPKTYGEKSTHSSLNETVLPDEFLQTWAPTFLIRHPALAFPSFYRTMTDTKEEEHTTESELPLEMTLHWNRMLYEWYLQYFKTLESETGSEPTWPLVLEADDIVTNPEVTKAFCKVVGMDPSKLKFSWVPATQEQLAGYPNNTARRMLSTLAASAGVVDGKTAEGLDINMEAKKWGEEFGEEIGTKIEKWVREAIPDYEFMKARRFRPQSA